MDPEGTVGHTMDRELTPKQLKEHGAARYIEVYFNGQWQKVEMAEWLPDRFLPWRINTTY